MVSSPHDRSKTAPRLSWTPEFRAFVAKNYQGLTLLELSSRAGCTYRQMASYLRVSGLNHKRRQLTWRSILRPPKTKAGWAYMAGIVDGEGTISIGHQLVNGRRYYRPHISISTTSPELVEWAEEIGLYGSRAKNNNGRHYWRATVSGWGIVPLLRGMMPYLRIKRQHAELLVSFITLRLKHPKRYTNSPELLEIYQQVKALNVRGSRTLAPIPRLQKSTT